MANREVTEVVVEVSGRSEGAQRAWRGVGEAATQASRKIDQAARTGTQSLQQLQAAAKNINIGESLRNLGAQRLGQSIGGGLGGDILSELGGMSAVLSSVSTASIAATAGVAALGAAAIKTGQVAVNQFTTLADQVHQFSFLTGKSAEESSGFALALNAVGLTTEQWIDRVRQFQTNLAQFPDRAREAGLEIERMADGTVDSSETMLNALKLIGEEDDVLERQRLGFRLFGESWTQLRNLIRDPEMFEMLREHWEGAFNEDSLQKAYQFQIATQVLKQDVQLLAAELGEYLVPWLLKATEALTLAARAADDAGISFLKTAAAAIGVPIDALKLGWDNLKRSVDFVTPSLGTVDQALGQVGATMQEVTNQARSFGAELSRTTNYAREQITGLSKARVEQADAAADLAEAEKDANRQIAQANATAADQIASASETLRNARESAAEASYDYARAVEDANRSIAKAEQDATQSIIDAQERAHDARLGLIEAQQDQIKAARDAARTLGKAEEDAADAVTRAQERVADAHRKAARAAEDAVRKQEDAAYALEEAFRRALLEEDTGQANRERQLALRDYNRTQEDVAESIQDAQENISEAEKDARDVTLEAAQRRAEAIEQAQERIASAQQRVDEALKRTHEAEAAVTTAVQEANARMAEAHRAASEQIENAARRVASSQDAVGRAEYNLAVTTANAEATRAYNVEAATNRVIEARNKEIQATAELEWWQRQAARAADEVRQRLQAIWDAQDPRNSLTRVTSQLPSVPYVGPPMGGRASGGRVSANSSWVVGENGIEVLQMGPGANGRIYNNDTVNSWGDNNGPSLTVIIQGPVYGGHEELFSAIERGWRDGRIKLGRGGR